MLRTLICVSVLLGVSCCAGFKKFEIPENRTGGSTDATGPPIEKRLQSLTDSFVNSQKLIGLQVSIKFPDGRTWNGASGTIDRNRKIPMRTDHLIRTGSLTKTYTAILIFQLADRKLLSLGDKLDLWFPDYKYGSEISVGMLLNHSSGIPDLLGMKVMVLSAMNGEKRWSKDELLKLIFGMKLDFVPGTDHQYSNSNYVLLGYIAERVAGRPLNELYQTELLKPAGLHHTVFLPSYVIPDALVTGYDRSLIPLPGWHATKAGNTAWASCAFSSGAMASSAADVLKLFDALQAHSLISHSSYQLMTRFEKAKNPRDKYLENFGMGLFKYGEYYGNTRGHVGLFVGSEAMALFSEEAHFILVILTNTSRIENSDEMVQAYLSEINN